MVGTITRASDTLRYLFQEHWADVYLLEENGVLRARVPKPEPDVALPHCITIYAPEDVVFGRKPFIHRDVGQLEIQSDLGECPMRCPYCCSGRAAAGWRDVQPQRMTLDMFKEIHKRIPLNISFLYYGLNDPLANEQTLDMLEHMVKDERPGHLFHGLVFVTDEDIERIAAVRKAHKVHYTIHIPSLYEPMSRIIDLDDAVRKLKKIDKLCNEQHDITYMYVVPKKLKKTDKAIDDRFRFISPLPLDIYNVFMDPVNGPPMDCVAPRTSNRQTHTILPNGEIYPCQYCFAQKEFRMGNILEQDFMTICNSDGYKRLVLARSNPCSKVICKNNCHRLMNL